MADEEAVPPATTVPDPHREMRVRAEGSRVMQIIWPHVPVGTEFVLVTDRGDEILGRGKAVAEYVRVDFEPHQLEKGRWYKVRPAVPEDAAKPRVSHDE